MTRETIQAGLKEKSRDLVKNRISSALPQHEELTVDFISPVRHGFPPAISLAFYNGLKAFSFLFFLLVAP